MEVTHFNITKHETPKLPKLCDHKGFTSRLKQEIGQAFSSVYTVGEKSNFFHTVPPTPFKCQQRLVPSKPEKNTQFECSRTRIE